MNHFTPENTELVAIANFHGRPWRVEAAQEYVRRLEPVQNRVVVHMGNIINSQDAQTSAQTLTSVLAADWNAAQRVFLRGENEQLLAERAAHPESLDAKIERLARNLKDTDLMLIKLRKERTELDLLLEGLSSHQKTFLLGNDHIFTPGLQETYAAGDYWFGMDVADIPKASYGIASRSAANGRIPSISLRSFKFNIAADTATAIFMP